MSNLFGALAASGVSLSAFERALEVIQNNVANAATPGYARQRIGLEAALFAPEQGLVGGVRAGDVLSARDQYADQEVRRQLSELGLVEQQTLSLASLEGVFDVSGETGIPGALNNLFQSFSAWTVTPGSLDSRQAVLDSANLLAEAFRQASGGLTRAATDTENRTREVIIRINDLAVRIREYNVQRRNSAVADPATDAGLSAALEELAQLVDFTALRQADGSVTVLLGGQTPLVIGDTQYNIRAEVVAPATPGMPALLIRDASGADITAQVGGGALAGLLDFHNRVLPGLLGGGGQAGDLNRLATAMADRVNELLTSGWSAAGPPPEPGIPLFTYDPANPATVAATLAVNPALTPDRLAAIDPGPPPSVNGVARSLANLASAPNSADRIDGLSYAQFYGYVAASAGRELAAAREGRNLHRQLTAQARELRDRISGVSLDQEAVYLVEFQRAYQATAKIITVLSDLTETAVNLIR